jgi:NADPH:quinone reductase-like Zn-dependent oxidoreductase
MQYQTIEFDAFGIKNLKAKYLELRAPKAGEVLIKVKAISLNYRDLLMVKGLYQPKLPLPFTPCSDAVGEVIAVGEGCHDIKVNQRVVTLFHQKWEQGEVPVDVHLHTLGCPISGTLSQYLYLPEQGLLAISKHLSDTTAATLSCAALTAWSALVELGNIQAGQKMLSIGTGGVSIFALQFAHLLGVQPYITSRTQDKLERLREKLDFDFQGILANGAWGKSIKNQIDHVIELGGAQTLEQALQASKLGGTISLIGNLSGSQIDFNFLPIVMKQLRLQGVLVGHKRAYEKMLAVLQQAPFEALIDKVYAWDDVQQAFTDLELGKHIGKLVIQID